MCLPQEDEDVSGKDQTAEIQERLNLEASDFGFGRKFTSVHLDIRVLPNAKLTGREQPPPALLLVPN
jgi:hypothetical protein